MQLNRIRIKIVTESNNQKPKKPIIPNESLLDKWNRKNKETYRDKSPLLKILVVDDEPGILAAINMILSLKNYYLQFASQAKDGLKILKKEKFDAIFSGLKMPGMDGIEFLKITKKLYPETEFIIVSSYATETTHTTAITLGAMEYLRKPFLTEEILELADRVLKKKTKDN